MAAGQHDQAVTAFRDALEEDPSNMRYQLNLSDAEAAAADQHVLQAEQHLSNQQPKEAKQELLVALQLMPGHPRAAVLMNEANAALDAGSEPQPIAAVPASKPAVTVVAVAKAPPPEVEKKVIAPQPVAASPEPAALKRLPAEPKPVAVAPPPSPAAPEDVFKGTISREDRRFKKELLTLDGITIKLNGTSDKPLRADMQVRVGDMKRDYKDLRVGTRLKGRGASRASYQLIILEVDDINETVSFAVEPIPD